MTIEYSRQAIKYIAALDRPTKHRIREAITGLMESPPKGDIKPLKGYNERTMRLRVGKFRIIYRYEMDGNQRHMLYVSDIDSRGDIYK